jgi:hypothetical protein
MRINKFTATVTHHISKVGEYFFQKNLSTHICRNGLLAGKVLANY